MEEAGEISPLFPETEVTIAVVGRDGEGEKEKRKGGEAEEEAGWVLSESEGRG
jgi:hypothetical protein